jgi:outer membrane protein assembly factor BamB
LGSPLDAVEDLNGDGIRDLVGGGDGTFRAFSGKDAAVLWTADVRNLLTSERRLQVAAQASIGDLNGDGIADLIVYQDDGVTLAPVSVLHALSGRSGRRLWSSEFKARLMPGVLRIASVDLDHDGVEEILWAGFTNDEKDTGTIPDWHRTQMWLVVLDGRTGLLRWRQLLSFEDGQSGQAVGFLQRNSLNLEIALADLDGDDVMDVLVPAEASLDPPRMEWRAFSGLDGRQLWSAPIELPRSDSSALADLLPCTVTDLDADGIVEVIVLDYVTEDLPGGIRQLLQRVRALSGHSGEVRWTRQFPVSHTVGQLAQYAPDKAQCPRMTVLRRRGAAPWLGLNLWGSPVEVVVLDNRGQDISRLPLETIRGMRTEYFRFDVYDVDGDGNDELVFFHQDALIVSRPESLGEPLWRWPVDTLNSHRVTQIVQHPDDASPTIVVRSTYGEQQVTGLDAASGTLRWICAGPSSYVGDYVKSTDDAIVLADTLATGPPRLLFRHRALSQSYLGRRLTATGDAVAESRREVLTRASRLRPASTTDPRFARQLPGSLPHVHWEEIVLVLAWCCYYSVLLLGLPLLYVRWLLRRRQWSLRMWLMLPAVVLLMLTAISTKASGVLFPTWGSRLFGAVATLPLLWVVYRVVSWGARWQWGRAGRRVAVFVGLAGLFFLIPWALAVIRSENILEDGEYLTFDDPQWLLIPAAFFASGCLVLWDLGWMAFAFLRKRFAPQPMASATEVAP